MSNNLSDHCRACAAPIDPRAEFCVHCGVRHSGARRDMSQVASTKLAAGLCGILVGGLGVHKFILGMTKEGIIQIVLTIVTCGFASIVGLVEGIIYLTKSDEDFEDIYINGKKPWF